MAFHHQRGGSGDEEDRPIVAAGRQERLSSSSRNYQSLRDPTQLLNNRIEDPQPFTRRRKEKIHFKKRDVIFLVLVLLSGIALLVFESVRLHEADHKTDIKSEASFTFAILVIVNAICIMVVATHSIVYEHVEQMIGFGFACSVLFGYVLIDFIYVHKKNGTADTAKTVRFALVVSAYPLLGGFAWYCTRNFGWVSSFWNEREGMYKWFCRLESLLFFDFQLAASLFIIVLHRGSEVNSTETAILTVGLIYCLAWAIAGYFVTRYETKKGTSVFMLLSVLLLVYIIYKFVFIGRHWHDIRRKGTHELAIVFIVAAVLNIFIRGLLVYVVSKVRKNFGKGLWTQVENSRSVQEEERQGEWSNPGDDAA